MSLQKPIILYVLGYTISDASSRIVYQYNPLSLQGISLNALRESLLYIKDKFGLGISRDYFNHMRTSLNKSAEKNLKYLQKDRFAGQGPSGYLHLS